MKDIDPVSLGFDSTDESLSRHAIEMAHNRQVAADDPELLAQIDDVDALGVESIETLPYRDQGFIKGLFRIIRRNKWER